MPDATVPPGLATAGTALWVSIADSYALRADEKRVLEDACSEADMVSVLSAGLVGQPLMVKGSQGQDVINPLISELRQHRTTLASLLRQLKLPDDEGTAEQVAQARSSSARAAANARWSRRGA